MYGKLFASCFTGSMFGAGADVFAVWAYVISNCQDSAIELNPSLLAAIIGAERAAIESAIGYLCSPDPNSRNPAEDGRRLVHEGAFQYRVVSHGIYRAIQKEEQRREHNRIRKQKQRSDLTDRDRSGTERDGHTLSHLDGDTGGDDVTVRDLSASVSISERGESEAKLVGTNTPEMIASAVLTECRISGRELRIVLEDVARAELKAGSAPGELLNTLISAYRQYSDAKPRLSYTKGTAKFFGEGDWRDPLGWPWKDGANPKINPLAGVRFVNSSEGANGA
jgi:hypothetical protein